MPPAAGRAVDPLGDAGGPGDFPRLPSQVAERICRGSFTARHFTAAFASSSCVAWRSTGSGCARHGSSALTVSERGHGQPEIAPGGIKVDGACSAR